MNYTKQIKAQEVSKRALYSYKTSVRTADHHEEREQHILLKKYKRTDSNTEKDWDTHQKLTRSNLAAHTQRDEKTTFTIIAYKI